MPRRLLLSRFLVAACLATFWAVWSQRIQLTNLRSEQQQVLAQTATNAPAPAAEPAADARAASVEPPTAPLAVTPELLRLRSEVTRLMERRRELASVRLENERLRSQVASRGTNGAEAFKLPPGYVRKRDAQMAGYNTPEDTLQSLLWAIQNHDLTNMLQAFSTERAEELRAEMAQSNRSAEDFFHDAEGLVGMGIVRREQDASGDGMHVEVEMVPGMPRQRITFRRINAQWKIDGPF